MERTALISPSGLYRYRLGRRWSAEPAVLWIMLNPSTADSKTDDATIRRCIGYAQTWGFGAILVGNVFPYRTTDPRELLNVDRDGFANFTHIRAMMDAAALVVCAWGSNPLVGDNARVMVHREKGRDVPIRCLGLSSSGAPFHPLQRTRKLHLPTAAHLIPF